MVDYAFILSENYPGKSWTIDGDLYSGIVWLDKTIEKPTKDELDKQYSAWWKQNNYKVCRKHEYPPITEQLDMLWHSMDSQEIPISKEFYMAIKEIKDKYPAP